jgi:zona occludens toxin
MLTLYTGVPGSGKTLCAVKELLENALYKDRPVYYYGLAECKVEAWTELTLAQLDKWYELPESSVLFVDECQKVWRPRKTSSEVPRSVQEMETSRHLGIDLLLTCQKPVQLDTGVRALVGYHKHYTCLFNSSFYKVYEFDGKCVSTPDSRAERKEAIVKNGKFDSKYFGLYKSAEVHHKKAHIPMLIYILIALVCFIVLLVWYGKRQIVDDIGDKAAKFDQANVQTNIQGSNNVEKRSDARDYQKLMKPRIQSLPMTAPIYDPVVNAVSYPRVSGCMEYDGNCQCNNQQGSLIVGMPQDICLAYLYYGSFDFSKPDDQDDYERYLPTGAPCCDGSSNTNNG